MGGENITDDNLASLGVETVGKTESDSRKLKIPKESLEKYIELAKTKLTKGFWNEIVGPEEILFIFRFKDGHIEEYILSLENEAQISKLCTQFNNDPPEKTANVYKYITNNDFYHDFMLEHYANMINRQ